ncbi:MAG: helix-turn-helix transcriptional regulator [Gemmatimonadaceae bacterium]
MIEPNDNDDAIAWELFRAECETLLQRIAAAPDADAVKQLERITDPLVHLVGFEESRNPLSRLWFDQRVIDYLVGSEQRVSKRLSPPPMTDDERRALRDRIGGALAGERLRLRSVDFAPRTRRAAHAGRIGPALLTEAEREHHAVMVPELAIAAGAGADLWELECDTLVELPAEVARGQYVTLRVTGDSMEPLLHSGDVLLVRLGGVPTVGTVVVARVPDHGYVVKEVRAISPEHLELHSLNRAYSPLRIPRVDAEGAVLGTVLLRWCSHSGPPIGGMRR